MKNTDNYTQAGQDVMENRGRPSGGIGARISDHGVPCPTCRDILYRKAADIAKCLGCGRTFSRATLKSCGFKMEDVD